MNYTDVHLQRRERVMRWYAPARFGLFYHWGLFTGGGNTHREPENDKPLKYLSPQSLEEAAGEPLHIAQNMVAMAEECGAKYITLTALHTNGGLCVIYPTKLNGFVYRTSKDYLGTFIRVAAEKGIKPIVYLPCQADHWESASMGPCMEEGYRDKESFAALLHDLADELHDLHGDRIAGFWIDGMTPELTSLPEHLHRRFPESIVINNNNTSLDIPDVDYGTTEFLPCSPEPDYCRPNALRQVAPYNISIPGRDFNEDIPTCNGWWYREGPLGKSSEPYLADPRYLLRQMISSLGQRGQWNFTLGIGPRLDGTLPPEFEASWQCLADFMAWGKEAISNTTGGESGQIEPGYFTAPWSPQGFCSVTVSLSEPSIHYILVTQAPASKGAGFRTHGAVPRQIHDLRTGAPVPFRMTENIIMDEVDWSDVDSCGVKVFKVEF
jgi:alpha-L-fucosidase